MEDEDMLKEIYKIGEQIAADVIHKTNGKGHLIIGSIAVVLASFEMQHEGTIKDVVDGANLMIAMRKAVGASPGTDAIN